MKNSFAVSVSGENNHQVDDHDQKSNGQRYSKGDDSNDDSDLVIETGILGGLPGIIVHTIIIASPYLNMEEKQQMNGAPW